MTRHEKQILGAAAALLLLAGGWFALDRNLNRPYAVAAPESSAADSRTEPEGENWPDSLLEGERIDLNNADEYDLGRLPGIGPVRAKAIVEDRAKNGPFRTVEELDRVSGIGAATVDGVRPYVLVENMEG